jgi:hypothetical protein
MAFGFSGKTREITDKRDDMALLGVKIFIYTK